MKACKDLEDFAQTKPFRLLGMTRCVIMNVDISSEIFLWLRDKCPASVSNTWNPPIATGDIWLFSGRKYKIIGLDKESIVLANTRGPSSPREESLSSFSETAICCKSHISLTLRIKILDPAKAREALRRGYNKCLAPAGSRELADALANEAPLKGDIWRKDGIEWRVFAPPGKEVRLRGKKEEILIPRKMLLEDFIFARGSWSLAKLNKEKRDGY